MRKTALLILSVLAVSHVLAAPFAFRRGHNVAVVCDRGEAAVVGTALDIFASDFERVFGATITAGDKKGDVYIGTIGTGSRAERFLTKRQRRDFHGFPEGFVIVEKNGSLAVVGSDKRGTAYGILELSRMIGVSPWEWWADSPVQRRETVEIEEGFFMMDRPSVRYRGIFINDEDWGLTPWSYKTYEPSDRKGQVGPKTHARIFELLLRLRANTFWPAMHDCSIAFYLTPGNREMADKYSIFIGTSHCEPMARNTNAEWRIAGVGEYDYVNNRDNVLRFWEERVSELAGSDVIYTLGIRGVHDSKMLGANTLEEQRDATLNILKDQRAMLARSINPDVEKVPQVFIPYKEVLDVYNMGLEVPGDVCLMWCDDNYGYIRHFPDSVERARPGGNGIYYHISYWGRPHDYLWLSTAHPALVYMQMKTAYDKGADDMWILNVGDIKPSEYLIELFLDMAWDIEAIGGSREGLDRHLKRWLEREFGEENGAELLAAMNEYYRLAYIRKPEFMGGTRTEEADPAYNRITDLPWSEEEVLGRIEAYQNLSAKILKISENIPAAKRDCWFQLVEYSVRGAAEMNKKHLYGQLARSGKADWAQSDAAYDTIVALTARYSTIGGGKWKNMMNYQPRELPVFGRVPRTQAAAPMPYRFVEPLCQLDGTDYAAYEGIAPDCYGLGYGSKAISMTRGGSVTYRFRAQAGNVEVEAALAPNHPVEGTQIRYAVSVDGQPPVEVDYHTEGRSEEWKLNVLRNRALRRIAHRITTPGEHTLTITALDEGVVVDQIRIYEQ